jgi:mono/diheme cytochrome c family protein
MFTILTLLACGLQREPEPVAPVLALTGDAKKGEAQFQMTCANCHGALGNGVSRTPALAGNVHTFTDEELVDIMLNGREAMSPTRLSPQHAANILAYLRATWPE